ncbi:hypothetical protein CYMTET_18467 [Cymbomonas tetramitiformis]|uniref:Uncharacterized protein n=1 Tax=Cymbomonas tetramitiformis TaxID=36881 RepID=A0AAE0G864_9CHLO|nr:hypothetical protein CYMTET_22343 [Cymbomonas tetramitiformis]KAK3273283.1 hypothetical protein CYMTET_18467 [Cymbomonas tetramitiformis]
MYFHILNLPLDIRGEYEYLEAYGNLNGIHPADSNLPYTKLVDELEEAMWEMGFGVWDTFSEEYVHLKCGPPDDYMHAVAKRMAEINEMLAHQSGRPKADLKQRFSDTGFKLSAAFARLPYFDLVLAICGSYAWNRELGGNRLARTFLGLEFNEGVHNFAKEEGVHPEWGKSEKREARKK